MKKLICFLSVFLPLCLAAHEGEVHGEAVAAPKSLEYFSTEAASDKYEVLLRYAPVSPGEGVTLKLFLSDFLSNVAVDSAAVKISSPDDPSLQFNVHRDEAGIYSVSTTFPEKKKYRINVNIDSRHGADLLALPGVEVGKELGHDHVEEPKWYEHPWLIFIGGLTGGLLLMYFLMKTGKKTKSLMLLLAFLPAQVPFGGIPLHAHGGEDHVHEDDANGGNNFTGQIYVPKETQFLFDMTTRRMETGDFTESVALYGTVVPSSNGQAVVQPAQSGKIYSLNVRVGEKVTKGQLLAILEPALDAASLINFAAERNTVNAEFEAAEKDLQRLESLKDIVSQQDIDNARARFNTAKENKRLFDGLATGVTDPSRLVYLRSPIDGVVENFTLTIGSTITGGETLFTITNLNKVYVEAQVFDNDVHALEEGGRFTVECTNDNHKTAEVRLVSMAQSVNATNQSQRVLFEMDNPAGEFKIGEFVTVRVFSKEPSREIAVPNSALTEINGQPVVFIKDAAEVYSVSYVQLGENNGEYTVVSSGVDEGERVIVNASYQAKMIYLNQ